MKSSCYMALSKSHKRRRATISPWQRKGKSNTWKVMNKRIHRGSDFRTFLKDEGILEEVEARALKQAVALQLQRLLKQKSVTKSQMAVRMKTSRAAVDRLLDASNS